MYQMREDFTMARPPPFVISISRFSKKHGTTCMMTSLNSIGLVGMIELARFGQLPIHAHRNGWGYLSRHPLLGWSYVAWQKIWRLAGADHMHVNGLGNKFAEEDESCIASARECLTPMFAGKPCTVMPVFSSAQTARQAPAPAIYSLLAATGAPIIHYNVCSTFDPAPHIGSIGRAACRRHGALPPCLRPYGRRRPAIRRR